MNKPCPDFFFLRISLELQRKCVHGESENQGSRMEIFIQRCERWNSLHNLNGGSWEGLGATGGPVRVTGVSGLGSE